LVSKKSVAIVGGGIAGLTTAYFLAKKDYKITVFDPEGIATQCSYANGGQLSVCNAETWNTYSNLIKGIKWMSRKDAPLAFRNDIWSWDKFKWVVGFVGATITNSYDYNTRKTIEWSLRSRRLYKKLIKELNIDFHQKDCGILHIYKNEKSWYKAQKTLERFKDTGWGRVVKKGNLLKYKIKTKEIVGATFTKGDSVGDIHTFCKELSNYLYNNYDYRIHVNKIVANKEVKYLSGKRDHAKTIDELKEEFDEVVICAGAYTPFILPHLNIYPIKGYSVTYHDEHDMPTTSILDDDAKIVASPFANNVFRVAGTAELAGWNHDIRMDRIKPLRRWVRKNTFVKDSRPENWACLRPMTPNMMPIVTKTKGVWVNSGAGHLGWTMGMALAEKVTNDIFKS
tara:strand:- start:1731 stop:2921 length:1191 start_codon:yes stop_codon:yes gene_type:complete